MADGLAFSERFQIRRASIYFVSQGSLESPNPLQALRNLPSAESFDAAKNADKMGIS
jgi:hypothetical protein